jgi:hypothetical protein
MFITNITYTKLSSIKISIKNPAFSLGSNINSTKLAYLDSDISSIGLEQQTSSPPPTLITITSLPQTEQ